jgi:pantoate--beta-alanine ligase
MKIFKSTKDLNTWRSLIQGSMGFVPTMGALHAGHLALVTKAKSENAVTSVSIFINPTQFNNPDDFSKYPKSLDADLALLKENQVDAVFLPQYAELYPDQYRYKVSEQILSQILCGKHRPGHFDGVLTVMLKLLQIVRPERCYMGEKDYQQYLLVKEMAKAFFLNTEIIGCETVREADGLALSSRNLRLSPAARERAPLIYKSLKHEKSVTDIYNKLTANGFLVDYVEEHFGRRFVAATIDGVRLIDNVEL